MKITLFIFAIILNSISLFYLPKVMEKRTFSFLAVFLCFMELCSNSLKTKPSDFAQSTFSRMSTLDKITPEEEAKWVHENITMKR